jgi:hypothetical protein
MLAPAGVDSYAENRGVDRRFAGRDPDPEVSMYGPVELSKGAARKVTVPEIRNRKAQGPAIAMVTAYDVTMARLVDEAGVDVV